MEEEKKAFVLEPEVEASIEQIADGLRKYLRFLVSTAQGSAQNEEHDPRG